MTERYFKTERYFPAEWAPQSAIMLTWPHQGTDWHDMLAEVEEVYFAIAKAVLKHQALLISCEDAAILERVEGELSPFAQAHQQTLKCYLVPADDTWARDHGPISIIEDGQPRLLDFEFNAWGDKFASSKDNEISRKLKQAGTFSNTQLASIPFILEGGSIESDGEGSLLTTEHCLLTETRNLDTHAAQQADKQASKALIETQLKRTLGVEQVLWLSQGYLIGDDTDAHIDTLARFCPDSTICYMQCLDSEDEHFVPLQKMEQELAQFRNSKGQPYHLQALPLPEAIYFEGRRLGATYANFLITNHSVLVPVYGVEQDQQALDTIAKCFPEREIVGINCSALIKQNGSLHCITMQLTKGIEI